MRTFETPEPISATIDVAVGDVRISAGDGSATTVDVQPTDASSDEDLKVAELTRVEYANGELRVKAPKLRSWSPRSAGGSIDVTIELPAGSHVHGSATAGSRPASATSSSTRLTCRDSRAASATSEWTVRPDTSRSRRGRATCACASSTPGR